MSLTISTVPFPDTLDGTLIKTSFGLIHVRPSDFFQNRPVQFAVYDQDGRQIAGLQDLQADPPAGVATTDLPWHVREDGGGAFTIFFLGDTTNTRTGYMRSFDAEGNETALASYELATRQIDVLGTPITQTLLEQFSRAVDLDGGRVAAFNHDGVLGTGHNLVIYNADGSIASRTEWDATMTGNVAPAFNGMELVRSGNNLFVFHLNTGLGGDDDFEVYGRVLDSAGNFVTDEFRVSDGTHEQGTFGFGSGRVEAETLAGGRVVVTWVSNKTGVTDTGELDIWFKIFNPDGSVAVEEQRLNSGAFVDGQQGQVRVDALDDGTFVVSYAHDDYGTFINTAVFQQFDADGNEIGSPQDPLARFQYATQSVIFGDGTGYIASPGYPTFLVNQEVPPPEGTDGDDVLTGTEGGDLLAGLGGNDTITGLGGDDFLFGDAALAVHAGLGVANAVFRLYQSTLDRIPDFLGHSDWAVRIATGQITLSEAAAGFVGSREFQNVYGALQDAGFVELLYQNVLGRAADAGGLQSWLDALGGGASRAEVVVGFSESTEFVRATTAAANAVFARSDPAAWTDEVYRLYQATLGRDPDAGGLEDWAGRLAGGSFSLADVAAGFVGSREFQNVYGALQDAGFVELLYQNVLGRASDAGGRQGWLDALTGGSSRADVVIGFSESREFANATAEALKTWVRDLGDNDSIAPGAGQNQVAGGMWADQFVFAPNETGLSRVRDLEAWDRIDLSGFGYQSVADARAQFEATAEGLRFADQGSEAVFEGFGLGALTDDMIVI
jgi:hypothetical protein